PHPPHRPLGGVFLQLLHRNPGEVVGLFGDNELVLAHDAEEETNIVMVVAGNLLPRRDAVDIEIEDLLADCDNIGESGLLKALPTSHGENVRIAVGMTSRLKPDVQFPMMGKQRSLT